MPIVQSSAPSPPAPGARATPPRRALRLGDGTRVWVQVAGLESGAMACVDERAEIVACDESGATVGRAAYARVYGPRAVLSLEIDDAYEDGGLVEHLLDELCRHGQRFGISVLLARVPASDVALLALLRERFAARETRDGRHVDVELHCRRRP